jgi:hypothetical protein
VTWIWTTTWYQCYFCFIITMRWCTYPLLLLLYDSLLPLMSTIHWVLCEHTDLYQMLELVNLSPGMISLASFLTVHVDLIFDERCVQLVVLRDSSPSLLSSSVESSGCGRWCLKSSLNHSLAKQVEYVGRISMEQSKVPLISPSCLIDSPNERCGGLP